MDPMFPEPETPHGFGIIDAMRDTQEDIDQLNDLMMDNAKIASKRRFFVRQDAAGNEKEYADLERTFVHFKGSLTDQSLREIASEPYSGTYVSILANKIDELKENSFNRDISNGGAGGTTTAAGIGAGAFRAPGVPGAAVQESGIGLSRVPRAYISSKDAVGGTAEGTNEGNENPYYSHSRGSTSGTAEEPYRYPNQ